MPKEYPEGDPTKVSKNTHGGFGTNYPANIKMHPILGLDKATAMHLAQAPPGNRMDNVGTYVNTEAFEAKNPGTWHYMCTRNNAFTNRSQKGKIIVAEAGPAGDEPGVTNV